jgi:hypothetical protein
VLVAWPDIVGERLAAATQPLKIEWPRRRGGADPTSRPDPATLVIRVESAFALDVQHLAPVIVERVNAHYGWRCVGQARAEAGSRAPRPEPRPSRARAAARTERERVGRSVERRRGGLRGALDRLGPGGDRRRRRTPTKA